MFLGGALALSGHALSHYTQRNSIGIPALFLHMVALSHLLVSGSGSTWLGWAPTLLIFTHLALVDGCWKSIKPKVLRPLLCLGLVFATCIHACQTVDRPDLILTGLGIILLTWAYVRKNLLFAKAGALPALPPGDATMPLEIDGPRSFSGREFKPRRDAFPHGSIDLAVIKPREGLIRRQPEFLQPVGEPRMDQ